LVKVHVERTIRALMLPGRPESLKVRKQPGYRTDIANIAKKSTAAGANWHETWLCCSLLQVGY
jgi:hypothetical protein